MRYRLVANVPLHWITTTGEHCSFGGAFVLRCRLLCHVCPCVKPSTADLDAPRLKLRCNLQALAILVAFALAAVACFAYWQPSGPVAMESAAEKALK